MTKKFNRGFTYTPSFGVTSLRQGGFTLIELLVVIAIIGILSSVVLGSLNRARTKGADAAIKADLDGVRSQAAIYFEGANTFGAFALADCSGDTTGTVFDDPNIKQAIAHAVVQGGTAGFCVSTNDKYAIAVPLKGGGTWCADSSGVSRNTLADGTTSYTGPNGVSPNAIETDFCN